MASPGNTLVPQSKLRPQSREDLILHHQKLVYHVVARYQGSSELTEDLIQVAMIGLINALDRYDPSKDIKFSTYAMPTIVGEIKRHFRDKTWQLKVPRWLQELSLRAAREQQALAAELDRAPTLSEVAARLGVPEDEAHEALAISHVASAVSLDTRLEAADGTATLMDMVGRSDPGLNDIDSYFDLRRALELLDDRERQVIQFRFFEELSQAKTARRMSISQMQVSRLQQKALQRLAAVLTDQSLASARFSRRNSP